MLAQKVAAVMDPDKLSVFVASPIYNDQCYGSYTNSLLALQAALLQRGVGFQYAWTKSASLITTARNYLVDVFLTATNATHLLFVDADMVFRGEDVLRMLDSGLDIIAPIYPRKEINWANIALAAQTHVPPEALAEIGATYGTFVLADPISGARIDSPTEVTGIGTGIMLIKREVFFRMAAAYPNDLARIDPRHRDSRKMHTFFTLDQDEDGNALSEDMSFCQRWRVIGGKIYGAPWFEVGHIGNFEFRGNLAAISDVGGSI